MFLRFKLVTHKLLHWEYWPMWAIYAPMAPLWIWYFLRTGSASLYRFSNPGLPNGGMYEMSKQFIYDILPPELVPQTVRVERPNQLADSVNLSRLRFPLIAKPDDGCRGVNVRKIESVNELLRYATNMSEPFLIQEYISYPMEAGVFYVRDPETGDGRITGITLKEFMTVVGDGNSSLRELIFVNKRFRFQLGRLEKELNLDEVLAAGEERRLGFIGNHNLGTKFTDGSHLLTAEMEAKFCELANHIPGFYYGRFDIRFETIAELQQGQKFSIIELNGALSEPTQMYDPKYNYFQGISFLWKHHRLLLEIGRVNARQSEMQPQKQCDRVGHLS